MSTREDLQRELTSLIDDLHALDGYEQRASVEGDDASACVTVDPYEDIADPVMTLEWLSSAMGGPTGTPRARG